jgi:hypothetical protein
MTTPHRTEPHPKKFVTVDGKRMAYVELGSGEPVFLFCTATRPPPTSGEPSYRKLPASAAASRRI